MSRELMKEFRTLRDLRHDNINSFIGEFFLSYFSFFCYDLNIQFHALLS
jgi:hypothetical protein